MTGPLILHGVVPGAAPRPPGAPDHDVALAAGLGALLSAAGALAPGREPDPPAVEEALRRHHAILCAHAAAGDVLPLRFGTVVPCRRAAADLLARRAEALRRALTAVAGLRQYVLTAAPREAAGPPAGAEGSGRAYLRARADARARTRSAAAECRALAEAARAVLAAEPGAHVLPPARTAAGSRADGLRILALVPQARIERLAERLGALDAATAGAALTLSGPWPPYDFAAADLTEAAA